VTSAVDTGIAVNPDTIVAQLQGGLIFGLTAALYGEVTVKKWSCTAVRISTTIACCASIRCPPIEVLDVIKSGEAPGVSGNRHDRPDRPR